MHSLTQSITVVAMRIAQAAEYLGMSVRGVREAANAGRLPHTVSASGQRIFERDDLAAYLGRSPVAQAHAPRVEALYVRVSGSTGQRASLSHQETMLRESASGPVFGVYRDRASGLRENRKGLRCLLDDAEAGHFTVVRVVWRDRLARFGASYIERHLTHLGITVEVVKGKPDTCLAEELMDDFMALIAGFAGRVYRLRSRENQRRLLEEAGTRL